MLVYAVLETNLYTAEYDLKNYVHFCSSFEDAQKYIKEEYIVHVEEPGIEVVFEEDDGDSEYGERSVLIDVINVGG